MKGEAERQSEEEVKENKEQQQSQQQQQQNQESQQKQPQQVESSASSVAAVPPARTRQPFTQLSQLESDMALARALQDQERAYMLLRSGGAYYDGYRDDSEEEGDDGENDQFEAPAVEAAGGAPLDGSQYENDEAFARALQEAEDRETTARMMALAGIHDLEEDGEDDEEEDEENEEHECDDEEVEEEEDEEDEDDGSDESQDMWQDVDPDNMSYEELIALGDVVGTESKGLAASSIAKLPVSSYKRGPQSGDTSSDSEQCVICRHDYEEEDPLLTLPCKHKYHSECIQQWLQINKVCPVCSAEVGGSS